MSLVTYYMFTYSIYLLITRYNELSFTWVIWAAQQKWHTHLFTNVHFFFLFLFVLFWVFFSHYLFEFSTFILFSIFLTIYNIKYYCKYILINYFQPRKQIKKYKKKQWISFVTYCGVTYMALLLVKEHSVSGSKG